MLKSILILFRPNDEGHEILEHGIELAQKLKAHLHVVYAHQFATSAAFDPYGEMRRFVDNQTYQDLLKKQASHIDEEKIHAKKLFEHITSKMGMREVDVPSPETIPSASWEHFNASEHEALSARGILNELIILGDFASGLEDFNRRTIELALFNTRRPVLVVPSSVKASIGQNVLVAWNKSAQSGVALSAALPILQIAKNVEIFSIDTGAKQGASAEEAVNYLALRGVKTNLNEVPRTPPHVGEIILDQASAIGADLIVMGAYSHSRMREMILGGVTQHILDHATLPVMMVH